MCFYHSGVDRKVQPCPAGEMMHNLCRQQLGDPIKGPHFRILVVTYKCGTKPLSASKTLAHDLKHSSLAERGLVPYLQVTTSMPGGQLSYVHPVRFGT